MFTLSRKLAIAAVIFVSACDRSSTVPDRPLETQTTQAPTEGVFRAALDAIRQGDPRLIASLNESQSGSFQTEKFLEGLYSRYGKVSRIYPLTLNQEAGISRGVFLAAHEGGPFVWDIIHDGESYTMLRGSTELTPFLKEVAPPQKALAAANQAIGDVNEGRAKTVFPLITCNCIDATSFEQQVEALGKQAGTELKRRLVSAESVPGAGENMALLHFLSERKEAKLGFHLMMWKTGDEWKISSINWTQEELIPRGSVNVSRR